MRPFLNITGAGTKVMINQISITGQGLTEGMLLVSAAAILQTTECHFSQATTSGNGGILRLTDSLGSQFTNTSFTKGQAAGFGGAVSCENSDPVFTSVTFSGHSDGASASSPSASSSFSLPSAVNAQNYGGGAVYIANTVVEEQEQDQAESQETEEAIVNIHSPQFISCVFDYVMVGAHNEGVRIGNLQQPIVFEACAWSAYLDFSLISPPQATITLHRSVAGSSGPFLFDHSTVAMVSCDFSAPVVQFGGAITIEASFFRSPYSFNSDNHLPAISLYQLEATAVVLNSQFRGTEKGILAVQSPLLVTNCSFYMGSATDISIVGSSPPFNHSNTIGSQLLPGACAIIDNSSFQNGVRAVLVEDSRVEISRCQMWSITGVALWVSQPSAVVVVHDCQFNNGAVGVIVEGGRLSLLRSSFAACDNNAVRATAMSEVAAAEVTFLLNSVSSSDPSWVSPAVLLISGQSSFVCSHCAFFDNVNDAHVLENSSLTLVNYTATYNAYRQFQFKVENASSLLLAASHASAGPAFVCAADRLIATSGSVVSFEHCTASIEQLDMETGALLNLPSGDTRVSKLDLSASKIQNSDHGHSALTVSSTGWLSYACILKHTDLLVAANADLYFSFSSLRLEGSAINNQGAVTLQDFSQIVASSPTELLSPGSLHVMFPLQLVGAIDLVLSESSELSFNSKGSQSPLLFVGGNFVAGGTLVVLTEQSFASWHLLNYSTHATNSSFSHLAVEVDDDAVTVELQFSNSQLTLKVTSTPHVTVVVAALCAVGLVVLLIVVGGWVFYRKVKAAHDLRNVEYLTVENNNSM